jgi:hypothetical protein
MPLIPLSGLLTAVAVCDAAPRWLLVWQRALGWWTSHRLRPEQLALISGVTFGAIVILYTLFVIPRMNAEADTRRLGQQINEAIGVTESLVVFDFNYQPALFYVKTRPTYVTDDRALPDPSECVLVRSEALKKLGEKWRTVERRAEFTDKAGRKYALISIRSRRI